MAAKEDAVEPETVVIKRYPNRRLYDTSAGKYVNLAELAEMIRKGVDIQAVDARTGEDLTRVLLTQIIAEDAKEQPTGLPLELLRQLILASDRAGQEFLMWYLRSAFDTYRKVQDAVQSRLDEVRSAAMSPVNAMKSLLSGQPGVPPESELEQLRCRIAELEAKLEKPPRTVRKRPARSGRKRAKSVNPKTAS